MKTLFVLLLVAVINPNNPESQTLQTAAGPYFTQEECTMSAQVEEPSFRIAANQVHEMPLDWPYVFHRCVPLVPSIPEQLFNENIDPEAPNDPT